MRTFVSGGDGCSLHQRGLALLIFQGLGEHHPPVFLDKRKTAFNWLMLLTVVLAVGCVGHRTFVVDEAVGPRLGVLASDSSLGTLLVFSALQTEATGSDSTYQRHADYWIFSVTSDWKQKVRNEGKGFDPKPVSVDLPPGDYRLEAPVVRRGLPQFEHDIVVARVVIKRGLTTVVHLDGRLSDHSTSIDSSLVRLTNGFPIGWKASQ